VRPRYHPPATEPGRCWSSIGILRIGLRDFLECRRRRFQSRLQEESDAVVVPAGPVFLRGGCLGSGTGARAQNAQRLGVLGDRDNRQVGIVLDTRRLRRYLPRERPLSIVIGPALYPGG